VTFEIVVLGSRWGATQFNSRRNDVDAAPMGVLFTLAGDGHCERIVPAFNYHRIYRPVIPMR
jgi:hypothetical protein